MLKSDANIRWYDVTKRKPKTHQQLLIHLIWFPVIYWQLSATIGLPFAFSNFLSDHCSYGFSIYVIQSQRSEARESSAGWSSEYKSSWLWHGISTGRRLYARDFVWVRHQSLLLIQPSFLTSLPFTSPPLSPPSLPLPLSPLSPPPLLPHLTLPSLFSRFDEVPDWSELQFTVCLVNLGCF